jgi:hypothetical protein
LSWLNDQARASRFAVGVSAVDGITWKVCRSPIHGLGSWLIENAWISGLFWSLLPLA